MQKLLLLHGALGCAQNFDELKSCLDNDFEIYTFSFEGHGGNEVPEALSIPRFADEVLVFLEKNRVSKISVFGYSMGGYIGLYLAKHFPEKIGKLFTLATKLHWTDDGGAKESAMLNPETIKIKIPKYAIALENLHGQNWEELVRKTAQMILDLGKSPALQNDDFLQISIPVQIAVGDKDAMVTIEESVNAFRQLSDGRFLVLPNTQHPIEKVSAVELAQQIRNYFG